MQKQHNEKRLPANMLQKNTMQTPDYFPLFLSSIKLPASLSKDDPIEVLCMPTRVENALKRGGDIKTIGQFINCPETRFKKIRNVGIRTMEYFSVLKKKLLENPDFLTEHKTVLVPNEAEKEVIPSNQLINMLLSRCKDEREKDIIKRRYGLDNGEKQTLEEIGESYKITRERIRQIQAKVLGRMKHPATKARKPITELVDKTLFDNGGIITDEEADDKVPLFFGGIKHDGSALLDMFSDLGWIQSCKIGDVIIYSPNLGGIKLWKISDKIISIIRKERGGIPLNSIKERARELSKINDVRFNPGDFILRYCMIDPRIEALELNDDTRLFRHYTAGHTSAMTWINLMTRIFEDVQEPLHFTEITDMVNDLIKNAERKLDVRRAHCILIESQLFAHSGIRGMYGLSAWGLRKETTPELVKECLSKAGFPLHWKQIYNYVSKYKSSKPASITSILENNRMFRRVGNGMYGLNQ